VPGGVTARLPVVASVPAQPSPEVPPLAVQLVAFDELQVSVAESPAVIVVGAAASVVVTGGHDHVTVVSRSTCVVPGAVQWMP